MENKKENNNGKMTLDKLAGMVARGFGRTTSDLVEVKNKLREHDRRFSEHDKRFDKLEFKIDEVQDALERLEESDILNLQKRVQILEKAVRALATSQSSK
jgi:predicted nuclease with TOPRIM domain